MTQTRAPFLAHLRRTSARVAVALTCAGAVLQVQVGVQPSSVDVRYGVAEAAAQTGANSTLAVLVVPVQRKNADDAEALERMLSDAALRLDTVRLYELSPSPDAEISQKSADLVEEALRALLLRTPKRAQERLATALQQLGDHPMAGDERLYARLFKAQGLTYLAAGELVKARDHVVRSLLLVPDQTPEEYAAYGSSARELFEASKGTVARQAKGDLKIVTKGAKADIWVDGQYRGAGVAAAPELPAGTHRVTVRASGYQAERRFVEVVAGKPTQVEFDLKPAPFNQDLDQGRNVLIANFKQPSVVEDRIRELRNQLGADMMMVVRPNLGKKATELSGYLLGADGSFKKVETAIDKDEKYFDKLGEFLAVNSGAKLGPDLATLPLDLRQSVVVQGEGKVRATSDSIDPNAPLFEENKDKEKPITSKWWFWTAVAGGAGLLGGGIYLLTQGESATTGQATGTVDISLHKAQTN